MAEEAQADRADTTVENLTSNLLGFLMYVLQENHTTEQAMEGDLQKNCEDIVFDKIATEEVGYDERTLLQHKRMWDVMSRNKEGVAKERTFIEWCRRVQEHRCFKSLAVDLLSNDLTPAQQYDYRYKIKWDWETGEISLTTQQRSWINTMLRKNLGDARVSEFIFKDGLPKLLHASHRRKTLSKAMLRNMLVELMTWHASLLQSLLDRGPKDHNGGKAGGGSVQPRVSDPSGSEPRAADGRSEHECLASREKIKPVHQANCDDTVVPARMMVEQLGASETIQLEASVSMKTQVKDNSERGTATRVEPSPETVARPTWSKEQPSSSVEEQPSSCTASRVEHNSKAYRIPEERESRKPLNVSKEHTWAGSACSFTAGSDERKSKAHWTPEEREIPKPRYDTQEQACAGRSDRKRNIHALSADPTSGGGKWGLRELLLHPQLILDTNGQWTTVAALAALALPQKHNGHR